MGKNDQKIWRSFVAPFDAREKNRNIGTVHPVYNCSKKIWENLVSTGLLVRTNFFITSRFLDYLYELSHLLSALRSDVVKNFLYFIFIFDRNFAKIVAPPNDGNANYVVHLKGLSIRKKG